MIPPSRICLLIPVRVINLWRSNQPIPAFNSEANNILAAFSLPISSTLEVKRAKATCYINCCKSKVRKSMSMPDLFVLVILFRVQKLKTTNDTNKSWIQTAKHLKVAFAPTSNDMSYAIAYTRYIYNPSCSFSSKDVKHYRRMLLNVPGTAD